MTLHESKQIIRQWIRPWSDQKLIDVYAFDRDGKMSPFSICGCILGVTLAEQLHNDYRCYVRVDGDHYSQAKRLIGGIEAEFAYFNLSDWRPGDPGDDSLRTRRFSAILRAEMRRRERERDDEPPPDQVPYDQAVCSES